MIVDSDHNKMALDHTAQDSPPSYDIVTGSASSNPASSPAPLQIYPKDSKSQPQPGQTVSGGPGPSMSPTMVYHYTNPITSEHIVSLLPPDHPEMVCLQAGEHVPESKFGILGIIAAVVWFPLGIGLCLLDRKVKCSRCGRILDNGFCD